MADITRQSALEVARKYLLRGWSVIPVPYRRKNPGFEGWERLRLTAETAPEYFNGKPLNFGLLTGEPSGWVVDVDLDHEVAVSLALDYLPATPAIFGRASRRRSHWVYQVTGPVKTKKIRSSAQGMLVELRATGLQTVLPPSVHECGEPIEWEVDGAEPAAVDPKALLEAVIRLGAAVKAALGETAAATKERKAKRTPKPQSSEVPPADSGVTERPANASERCLKAMLHIGIVDRNDGSSRLYTAACRSVEHDLTDLEALAVLRRYEHLQPFPRTWSDDEVLQRVRDAEQVCQRGAAFQAERDEQGLIRLGTRDPETGRLVLSPKRTLPSAQAFVREFYEHPERCRLVDYAGTLWEWKGNHYVEQEDGAIRQRLHPWLHDALRYVYNRSTKELELVSFDANPASVNAVLETTKAYVHLPSSTSAPCWLDGRERPVASEILVGRTKLLHLPSGEYLAPTPLLFTQSALDYDPEPVAPEPVAWFNFLHELLEDDTEAWDLLQQWFGYLLTADTSLQKMLLIVGPRRSGKGTLGRILKALIGVMNVCGPTTSSLAGTFGLQPLLGKSLAIVSDARFSGDNIMTVVERLLCISGEDAITIDRKHIGSVTVKLPTRFMFLTNELPRFNDSSAALAGRFLILQLKRSFYGQEDHGLTERLLGELPGILNWAIEGWHRLRERGHFQQPASVAELIRDLEDLASPVGAFVREACLVRPGCRAMVDDLYRAWCSWCLRNGRNATGTKQAFGKDLQAAVPGIVRRRDSLQHGFYEGIGLLGGEL